MSNLDNESVSEKADRLKNSFRVILLDNRRGLVIGDHATYSVEKVVSRWTCDCRWGRFRGRWKECSHIVAVKRARKDPACQAPVARLADLLLECTRG